MVTILMLVYNANLYTYHTLKTLKNTEGVEYEVVVLDNNSKYSTYKMLGKLKRKGYIDKIISLKENSYFVRGNNIASRLCSEKSDYIMLLNSDVEIRNSLWLKKMLEYIKDKKAVIATHLCSEIDNRPDGWCYLVDKETYLKKLLDEKNFEHTWAVAKFTGELLNDGYKIYTIRDSENFIYHFGGKSGRMAKLRRVKKLKGMETTDEIVKQWFNGKKCDVIEKIDVTGGKNYSYKFSLAWIRQRLYEILRNIGKKIIKNR